MCTELVEVLLVPFDGLRAHESTTSGTQGVAQGTIRRAQGA
jgi:hypothetical protein